MRAGKFALVFALLAGCGGTEPPMTGPPPPPPPPSPPRPTTTVTFEYHASTAIDPTIIENFRSCAILVGHTHIHTSWHQFDATNFRPKGDMLWAVTFDEVPLGLKRIRVSDANACPLHPTGAVEANVVYANGVLLTRTTDTPGTGIEPGFAFSVDEEGVVTP